MIFRTKRKTIFIENFVDFKLNQNDYQTLIKYKNIFFSDVFNEILPKFPKLPNNIKKIAFGSAFNFPIECSNLPDFLEYLQFGVSFNHPIDNLPLSLITLQMGSSFNQNISNLPSNLKILRLGHDFNQILDNLPCGLKILLCGFSFNRSVDSLPESLVWIKFSYQFNQQIDNLPINLLHIEFGRSFSQSINMLPNSIQTIIFSDSSQYILKIDKLPCQLEYLQIPLYDFSSMYYLLESNSNRERFLCPDIIPQKLKKIVNCNYIYRVCDCKNYDKYVEEMKQKYPKLEIVVDYYNNNLRLVSRYRNKIKF